VAPGRWAVRRDQALLPGRRYTHWLSPGEEARPIDSPGETRTPAKDSRTRSRSWAKTSRVDPRAFRCR
jgi:hypothetical protein